MFEISVNDILDAGLLVNGKLPDIFWDLDLTGAELKVLRYVYNNCLRLYKNLKWFPRGKDGSPRFWRGKEKMAEDCGLSYVTFRKSIRTLYNIGLVTSMEGEEDETEQYCIGLSCKYIQNLVNSSTVKNYRSHILLFLIDMLYDYTTVELVKNNLEYIPSLLLCNKELEVPSSSGVKTESNSQEIQNNSKEKQEKQTTKKLPKRTPIQLEREPVISAPEIIRNQAYSKKLKMLKNVRTPHEKRIYEMANYYEFKCRKALHSTGFRSLGKEPKTSKNWKYYEKILETCETNDWDYKIYIDSQFDRVNYWQRKQVYPYLNQMYSENATKYFLKYIKDFKESNSVTGDIKVKSEKVKSTNQIIIDSVIKDCEEITQYIEKAKKYRANKGLSPEELKILYISDHWMGLSDWYLSVIPWFSSYLESFPSEEPFVVGLKENLQRIQKSKSLYKSAFDIVEKVEKQMCVPKTLCL